MYIWPFLKAILMSKRCNENISQLSIDWVCEDKSSCSFTLMWLQSQQCIIMSQQPDGNADYCGVCSYVRQRCCVCALFTHICAFICVWAVYLTLFDPTAGWQREGPQTWPKLRMRAGTAACRGRNHPGSDWTSPLLRTLWRNIITFSRWIFDATFLLKIKEMLF